MPDGREEMLFNLRSRETRAESPANKPAGSAVKPLLERSIFVVLAQQPAQVMGAAVTLQQLDAEEHGARVRDGDAADAESDGKAERDCDIDVEMDKLPERLPDLLADLVGEDP